MAAGSSSSSVASHAPNLCSHDVFLSFRGDDTRNSFTAHLYDALKRSNIRPFRDDDDINRGEQLKPEIERAITESRASIVVLSKNYATSTWCLDELRLVLERRREYDHFVLPLFYHVDPSDVEAQQNSYALQVQSSGRWTQDNVDLWKAALTEVATLAGLVLSGLETDFLKVIVDTIFNKLELKLVSLPSNLTGMDTRYNNDINSWLEQSDAPFFIIWGMGGSGKTTLAKYVFNSNLRKFESISFLQDIGGKCKEHHDLLELQENLLQDILGGKKRKVPSFSHGTCKIEDALQMKKSLIVLDAIDEQGQLDALLGNGEINTQSKIIITTRVQNAEEWLNPKYWRCRKYKMESLNHDESLELLCRHAFRSKTPMEGFGELALKALQYCGGNPLALEVLGSTLFVSAEDLGKRDGIRIWKSRLNLLEKDMHSGIYRVLIRSYKSLPHDSYKELFLHIACFFLGIDMDYVIKILETDYSALCGIKTLIDRCLVSVSPNNKLMMHPLLQEMGRRIVYEESPKNPARRSRVWRDGESYNVLRKGEGSETMQGLALDMRMLMEEEHALELKDLKTHSLTKMDDLKLLQLKYVEFIGSYENFPEHLKWLCWHGFHLKTIPSDLFMGNVVAIDMSYSNLEVFEPPMVLKSLQVLNLKESHNLSEIRSIYRLPNLETLVFWNCRNLTHVCETIGGLENLVLLNMTGCESLCNSSLERLRASTGRGSTEQPTFSLPHSLERLFLKDCKLECTDCFTLGFENQLLLQYLNLVNCLFDSLPSYSHLTNLRVLDLSLCSRLKMLLCLPGTLAELYTYNCVSLEKITFESRQFTLQALGYEGCRNLTEIEGLIKLVPLAKLDETDLGHMKWLKEYQNHEMCLVGDALTIGRSWRIQMLYEFNIMSTSLPEMKDPNMTPEYISESSSLSFEVPLCPKNTRLKGLNVGFKYTISSEDQAWFTKINTNNGVDLMYNPKVFGKPEFGEVAINLSYWPIGNKLNVGDKVNVSIAVMSGLEVQACGASLVYDDDEVAKETLESNMESEEYLGGDLSGFQLSTGAYYLCRRDFYELMEVGRLTPGWFRILVGDTIDCTEVRGWRETGRPKLSNPSFAELKTVKCITHGPQLEEIYTIAERHKSPFVNKTIGFTSNTLGQTSIASEISDAATKVDVHMDISKASIVDDVLETTSEELTENNSPKMSRTGDWNCISCQHLNFQRRDSCQRCGGSRHGGGGGGGFGGGGSMNLSVFGFTGPDVRPGDWYCNVGNCGAHNFASRSSCFKCGMLKDDLAASGGGGFDYEVVRGRSFGFGGGSSGSSRSGWKSGDWICGRPGCNEHNFASRMECFKCNAPREPASKSLY